MGNIRSDVSPHLADYPDEEGLLKPFLSDFFVTWGRRRHVCNTHVSVYFINPESHISESFGFESELLVIYSPFNVMEPRSIQAAEQVLADAPAKGRVERLSYIFISEDPNVEKWLAEYSLTNKESRQIVPIYAGELRAAVGNNWFVRNKLSRFLYGRDLFDIRLPLENDTYFFGRGDLVTPLFDAIKRGENRAIFGLRKTGKTSILFKLERMLKANDVADVIYLDCKLPSVRKLRWFELLKKICDELDQIAARTLANSFDEVHAPDALIQIISQRSKPTLLVFDEIEYISPVAVHDKHWHVDFVDFWQAIWACQSRNRRLSILLAGVNPTVVEMDQVQGIQNPLFGIVPFDFVRGLSEDDIKNMVRVLGKRMGMRFDHTAGAYLYNRYGGHPLLTRLACSFENKKAKLDNVEKPISLTADTLRANEVERDSDLTFYCRHVVSELQQFYPDEYTMLEMLASRQLIDFNDLAPYPEYVKHLEAYGLLGRDATGRPRVAIPVVGRYVALELAKKEKRASVMHIVPEPERATWLKKRVESITVDMRALEDAIRGARMPLLYGPNCFPEADRFASLGVVKTAQDFEQFINVCNRCFVEPSDSFGTSVGKQTYFFDVIKVTYPALFDALHRIRLYRHHNFHVSLRPNVTQELLSYLDRDLDGKVPSSVSNLDFVLQQCVLDELLLGIQIQLSEIA